MCELSSRAVARSCIEALLSYELLKVVCVLSRILLLSRVFTRSDPDTGQLSVEVG